MKHIGSLLLAVVLALAVTGSSVAAPPGCGPSTLEVVKKRGTLIAGVRYDAPPWGFVDKNQTVRGFDVDIARYLAKQLGVKIQMVQVTAKTRIPLLLNGNVDLLAAGMGHYISRNKVIDFSISYYRSGSKFLVKRGSGIRSYRDLAGKTVGTVQGTPYEKLFLAKQPNAKVVVFQDYPQGVLALEQGRIAALQSAEEIVTGLAEGKPDLEVVGVTTDFPFGTVGLGMRQNDSDWRNWINFTLIDMWKNGTIRQLYKTYFHKEPDPDFTIETWDEF